MIILITGGSGLIGQALTERLQSRGHEVRILSRKKGNNRFYWNWQQAELETKALENVEVIVHLAGASVAQKWTKSTKEEILNSRIKTAELLLNAVKENKSPLKAFISSSGVNYYGTKTTGRTHKVGDSPANGNDFLSNVCIEWEKVADLFEPICRVVKVRTGVVLTPKGGAYQKMAEPIKMGVGAPLGSGKQIVPWIGLQDLVDNFYVPAIENEDWKGAYNAVDSEPITNKELTQKIAKDLKKPLWLPNVPPFVLHLLLGKMATMLLHGDAIKRGN